MGLKSIYNSSKFIIFIISGLIGIISFYFGVSIVMLSMLNFLIFLEITRTIYEYIVEDGHRIKMRFLIDGAILFGIRELFVGWVLIKNNLDLGLILMGISLLTVGILILYRIAIIKSSPDFLECK